MEANKRPGEITIAASQSLKEREYWMKRLSGDLIKTSFFYDLQEAGSNEHRFEKVTFAFTGEQHEKLIKLSNNSDPRLFMILIAGLITLLYKYTGNNDIILGTSIEKQVIEGDYVNWVLALRNQIKDAMTFKELLLQVRQNVIGAMENKNYPIETLLYDLKIPSSQEHAFPLFDIAILLENIQSREYLRHINLNMIFSFLRDENSIEGAVEFNAAFYGKGTVQQIIEHFILIIRQVFANPDKLLSHIEILPEEEKHRLLYEFNNTEAGCPDKLLHELFEAQVEKRKGSTALVYEDKHLTYRELNKRAYQLAVLLRERGVGADTIVGLMTHISLEMVFGILAILKAGGAYLPIEPDFPGDRIIYMMEDSHTPGFLIQTILKNKIEFNGEVIDLQEYPEIDGDGSDLQKITQSDNLAYVIYTSGSTGNPKGVMIRHDNIVNQLFGLQKKYSFASGLHHILMAPFTFDPSVQQVFLPLSTGGKLYLVSKNIKNDGNRLFRFLFSKHIGIFNTVPSLMNALLDSVNKKSCKNLHFRYIILAGEVFTRDLYLKLKRCLPSGKIINIYGPTEATINTTLYECQCEEKNSLLPIGKPLLNYKVWILDKQLHMLPIGVPGELCISGEGVARGYLNKVEMTGEKFVMNSGDGHEKMYRSGDSARWLANGNIQFLGRLDDQVKIRGCRVEPGEIEKQLLMHDKIKQAAVVTLENKEGNKYLCAYISQYTPDETDIYSHANSEDKNDPQLWPSYGEYFVWDEMAYHSMTHDDLKNKIFEKAIKRLARDKTVVEIGTGRDAILARLCIDAGVKRVYAIEILEEAYKNAVGLVKKLGLEDKIILINGDATNVELPEKVDVCLANQVGTIASSEGAIALHNSARRLLKEKSVVIPEKSITKIAAVYLPQDIYEKPQFSQLGKKYQEKIFEKVGRPFDLRLCLKNFPKSNIISNVENFEELEFQKRIDVDLFNKIQLVIRRDARMDGFLLWLNLYTIPEGLIDVLDNNYSSWAPFYVPVFYPGIDVAKGDIINLQVTRNNTGNKLFPDYSLKGVLIKQENETVEFECDLPYWEKRFKGNPFYRELFENNRDNAKGDVPAKPINADEIKHYLENKLPDYMVPSYFITLDTIPLTPNGKIDRNALPEPEIYRDGQYSPPRNNIEKKLVDIWAEVLAISKDTLGIDSNFFKLGGDSLTAITLLSKLQKEFSVKLEIADIFEFPRIRALGEFLKSAKREVYVSIKQAEEKEYYGLSSAQKRLYILYQMDPESTAYNMSESVVLEGELKKEKLKEIFKKLMKRHDCLGTSFMLIDEEPLQIVHRDVEFEIEYFLATENTEGVAPPTYYCSRNTHMSEEKTWNKNKVLEWSGKEGVAIPITNKKERSSSAQYPDPKSQELRARRFISSFIRPFDLSIAPLIRIGLIKTTGKERILIVDMHHIITDGTSIQLLIREFVSFYRGEGLPELRIQYKDFSEWQNKRKKSPELRQQEEYWLKELAGEKPVLNLPTDYKRPEIKSIEGKVIHFVLGRKETSALKQMAVHENATLFMLILAIYVVLLSKLSGQEDILVGIPTAGRAHADLENIIGVLINTLMVRNYPEAWKTFREFLNEVRKCTMQAVKNQDYQFDDLVEKIGWQRDPGRNPVFDVVINFMKNEGEPGNLLQSDEFGLKVRQYEYERKISTHDLTLYPFDRGGTLSFTFEYCKKLFKQETIEAFIKYFKEIVSMVVKNHEIKLGDINISHNLITSESEILREDLEDFAF